MFDVPDILVATNHCPNEHDSIPRQERARAVVVVPAASSVPSSFSVAVVAAVFTPLGLGWCMDFLVCARWPAFQDLDVIVMKGVRKVYPTSQGFKVAVRNTYVPPQGQGQGHVGLFGFGGRGVTDQYFSAEVKRWELSAGIGASTALATTPRGSPRGWSIIADCRADPHTTDCGAHAFLVHPLQRLFVGDSSLGIPPGECFGLLGINGAGKTTTLSMLSAEFAPTRGSISIAGHDIIRTPGAVKRLIGFCPQFDAVFDRLTAEEHLQM